MILPRSRAHSLLQRSTRTYRSLTLFLLQNVSLQWTKERTIQSSTRQLFKRSHRFMRPGDSPACDPADEGEATKVKLGQRSCRRLSVKWCECLDCWWKERRTGVYVGDRKWRSPPQMNFSSSASTELLERRLNVFMEDLKQSSCTQSSNVG